MKRKLFSKSSSVQNRFQACEVLNGYERFFVLIPSDGWDFLLYFCVSCINTCKLMSSWIQLASCGSLNVERFCF